MTDTTSHMQRRIATPDQRLRVFVGWTSEHDAAEHDAALGAVRALRMTPITADVGAGPYPRRDLYRSYVQYSDIFVAICCDEYGPVVDDAAVSVLEEEYRESRGMPRLIYVRDSDTRDPAMTAFLDRIREDGEVSYRTFRSAAELGQQLGDDLAVLLSERFTDTQYPQGPAGGPSHGTRPTLPVTPNSFVGRSAEIDHVLSLLRDPSVRLVTLFGPGGVGKTRLALEVGKHTVDDFPDGAVVVWLDAISDASFLLQALAAELRVKETSEHDTLAAIANRLRGHRMLVVLDNFEHVMVAAPLLADLIALPTGSKFLVTSRELLQIRGEHPVVLEPLPLPEHGEVDALQKSDAVTLFVDRARAASPLFSLTSQNAGAVEEIVRRLDGVPLALELAAAAVRMLPPSALLERLTSGLDLPGEGARDLPARQRTLRQTIAWSHDLLDDRERQALERLSVFPAGASIEAAQHMVGDLDGTDGLDLLESLLRKSLVRKTEDTTGGVWLNLLTAIREFAQEKLRERGEVDEVRARHARYYLDLAGEIASQLHSAEQPARLQALDDALENIAAALEWFADTGAGDDALMLAFHLRWYWVLRGHLTAADRWLRRLTELPASDAMSGRALTTAGMIALEIGDRDRAQGLFERALPLLDAAGDTDELAWAWTGIGAALHGAGTFAESERLQEQALATFRNTDDLIGQCTANTRIAHLFLARGDYTEAEQRFNGSLQVRRKVRDPWGTSYVLSSLGEVRLLDGDLDRAGAYFSEALELVREIDNRDGIARALDGLGVIAAATGRREEAAARFAEAVHLYTDVGNRAATALALAHLARAEVALERSDDASAHVLAALGIAEDFGDSDALAAAIETMGCVLALRGEAVAADLLGVADGVRARHRLPVPTGDPLGPGHCLEALQPEIRAAELEQRRSAAAALDREAILVLLGQARTALVAEDG